MARYTAEQIYAFAREAGFSPDRAATMTALAMAESGGNSTAHNPYGENSKGLWQINAAVHPQFAGMDLYDPVQNAKAAFSVSHGGGDISPWTTSHGGASARYVRFKSQAQAAAEAYGDGPNRGMWSGTSGYGDHESAGDAQGAGQGVHQTNTNPAVPGNTGSSYSTAGSDNVNAASFAQSTNNPQLGADGLLHTGTGVDSGVPIDDTPAPAAGGGAQGFGATAGTGAAAGPAQLGADGLLHTGTGVDSGVPIDDAIPATAPATATAGTGAGTQGMGNVQLGGGDAGKLQTFLDKAVAQSGDKYIFGAEVKLDDPNPSTFDCSELVEWASHQAGVKMPDGALNQYRHLNSEHSTMSVEQAMHTPGALLFSFDADPISGKPTHCHVAISLGNGKTIEAKGTQYGVGSWEANTKRFQYAGYMPEMMSASGGGPFVPTPAPPQPPPQDAFTHRVNNDPVQMDKHPATVQASTEMTHAAPPPEPPPMPPLTPPQPETAPLGDHPQDHPGDDHSQDAPVGTHDHALEQAMNFHPLDDPNAHHPVPDPAHPDVDPGHDAVTGH
jgi:hypothetical protein